VLAACCREFVGKAINPDEFPAPELSRYLHLHTNKVQKVTAGGEEKII
jgi:hypothetical protein